MREAKLEGREQDDRGRGGKLRARVARAAVSMQPVPTAGLN